MHYLFALLTWKYFVLLWLCSQGFVEGKHVMKLRQQLLDHGYGKTFTTEEKGQPNGDHTHTARTVCVANLFLAFRPLCLL